VIAELGNNWFVNFEDDAKATEALEHVRTQTINGQDVKARLRAKPVRKPKDAVPGYQSQSATAVLDMIPNKASTSQFPPTRLFTEQGGAYTTPYTSSYGGAGGVYNTDVVDDQFDYEEDFFDESMPSMFPYENSVVVDHIARDSVPEHLATFLKNAYGHEAVMVHIPTDFQTGATYGHAYAEFETEQAANEVCVRALSMCTSRGSIQVTMRGEWEALQAAGLGDGPAHWEQMAPPGAKRGKGHKEGGRGRGKGKNGRGDAGKGGGKQESKKEPSPKDKKEGASKEKKEKKEAPKAEKSPKAQPKAEKEKGKEKVKEPAGDAKKEKAAEERTPSKKETPKGKVKAANASDVLSPACPKDLAMPSPPAKTAN